MPARWLWGIVVALVVADQATKHWALNALDGGRTIDVVWTLRFALGFNSGFAFGTGQGFGVIIGLVAIGVICWMLWSMGRARTRVMALALAFVSGGAMGNVVDRLFRNGGWLSGKVVDFIDLQWWPVFNLADSAITVGAALLVVGTVLEARLDGRSSDPGADRESVPE